MLWLQHCVLEARRRLHGDQAYECVQVIATLDGYQGLPGPVVLASMVSSEPGIMKDVVRSNTLTSRTQSELHLVGVVTIATERGGYACALFACSKKCSTSHASSLLRARGRAFRRTPMLS